MRNLPERYKPVTFSQVFLPSLGMLIVGLVTMVALDYYPPLFGKFVTWGVVAWTMIVGCIAAFLLYLGFYYLSMQAWISMQSLREVYAVLITLFQNMTWPQIVVLSLSAGIGEELLFRGLLQNWLVSQGGAFWGILLSSILFGLAHFLSKLYILVTFFIGALLGLIYFFTDSLALVMVIHTVYDIIAFAVIVKYPSLLISKTPDNNPGDEHLKA